ncbi:nucleotide pyrophosphohydrolase [Sedimentibacter sp. zth1]|uniref:MazG nucleotide pyrophosphohydrolase domain-containing protein n=1 Tax=Sedimentibacter sp. zth1 TaxID=2816908 RepID=UPI001A92545E|nr:MazG nucleotide pyrophosphohydrolase domain-containing protein [Sedimentibacter sp. zth1]QSX05056.1 nucleotide pyrophosphohydrolase [Sedimentibacter sp. zth1]
MCTINIIGLGTGELEDLSVKAYNTLKSNIPTFLRTERHSITKEMLKNGIKYETFDNFFVEFVDFNEIYEKIVEKVVEKVKKYGKINYCIPGSPYLGDVVTKKLLALCDDEIKIEIYDAKSFLEECLTLSGYADYKSIKVLDCLEIDEFSFDINSVNFITQIDRQDVASNIKIMLMESYSDSHEVLKIDVLNKNIKKIPLYLLDQERNYEFSTYFCILPIESYKKPLYNINNLFRVTKILRGPEGCPWDRKQTHDTCKQCFTDEVNEALDAIDNKDYENLCEELGDVLFQVVFHSEIASEEGYFNINDVINNVCEKMIRRHPHVFGDDKAVTTEEALKIWNKEKQKEKEK